MEKGKGDPRGEGRPFIFRYGAATGGRGKLLCRTFPATIRKRGGRFYLPSPDESGNPGAVAGTQTIILPIRHDDPLNRVAAQGFFLTTFSASLSHFYQSHLFISITPVGPGRDARIRHFLMQWPCRSGAFGLSPINQKTYIDCYWSKKEGECVLGRTPCVCFRHGKVPESRHWKGAKLGGGYGGGLPSRSTTVSAILLRGSVFQPLRLEGPGGAK